MMVLYSVARYTFTLLTHVNTPINTFKQPIILFSRVEFIGAFSRTGSPAAQMWHSDCTVNLYDTVDPSIQVRLLIWFM
jgi:hypothetical protein